MTPSAPETSPRLGSLVRSYRQRAGLTQQEASRRAGISTAGLRNLEQGRVRAPRRSTLNHLAAALELSTTEQDELVSVARVGFGLQIGALGPLRIRHDGMDIELGSATQRTVLGLLALSPSASVSRDVLIDALWGPRPPSRAIEMLQNHVSRLRRRLGEVAGESATGLVVGSAGGYQLRHDGVQLDVVEFEETLARARVETHAAKAHALYSRCAALWRGAPLADLTALHAHPPVTRLARLRQDAVLEYADLAAALCRHAEVLPVLQELTGVDPLHEGLHARLMRALAACSQQAAALEVFDTLRRRLVDELGADPGPEITTVHQDILRQDVGATTPVGPVVHQLPADITEFTGRQRELARLQYLVSRPDKATTAVPVVTIQGMAGIGKTRLAVHFAHHLVTTGCYAAVQLYGDLRGNADQPPADPAALLSTFLRHLGVPGPEIPDGIGERAALYRDRLHGRHALVLLDDADSHDQVLPLIPGDATNLVLITSRRTLALDGAHTVALGVLPTEDATALLGRIAGPDRIHHDPADTQELVHLCGRLPLALTLAGRRLQARPTQTVADLNTRLVEGSNRVESLSAGARRLRAVFDHSYDALPGATQEVFRLLGRHPGPSATNASVAAMAGITPAAALGHMERLTDEHLVSLDAADRYRLHDLLREYAFTRADENDDDVHAAVHRLAQWYLHAVGHAREAMFPHMRDVVLDSEQAPAHVPRFTDGERAYRWLAAEHGNMVATIDSVAERGTDDRALVIAWQLPVLLKHYFERSGQYDDWLATGRIALEAAQKAGDRNGEGLVHSFLGIAAGQLERFDEALGHLTRAWRIAEEDCDQPEAVKTLNNLALVHRARGRLTDAVEALRTALAMAVDLDDQVLTTRILSNLGSTYSALGEHDEAIAAQHQALAHSRKSEDPIGVVGALQYLGEALVRAGRGAEACPYLREALSLYRRLHYRLYEAETRELLAQALEATAEYEEARAHRMQAREIREQLAQHRRAAHEP